LVSVDTTCYLEGFRRFLIYSTCLSFAPESYLRDPEVFPEKEGVGAIYVEAGDKVTLKKIREIVFINARDILGIIYQSKTGNTKLKWRQTRGKIGRVTGEASANSLVNLLTAGVITREYAEGLAQGAPAVAKPAPAPGTDEVTPEEPRLEAPPPAPGEEEEAAPEPMRMGEDF
jgi:hypothetical protein